MGILEVEGAEAVSRLLDHGAADELIGRATGRELLAIMLD